MFNPAPDVEPKEEAAEETRKKETPKPAELWSMDEHRVGLKPILRRVWAKRGRRPVAVIRPRYQWLWVVSFVHPETGRSAWWLVPRINKQVFIELLRAFAEEYGAGVRLLLVLDGAGWHKKLEDTAGVELIYLPAYSPELQPAEHLWTLADEVLVNRWFTDIEALEAVLAPHLAQLSQASDRIRSLTFFHWWPIAPRAGPI